MVAPQMKQTGGMRDLHGATSQDTFTNTASRAGIYGTDSDINQQFIEDMVLMNKLYITNKDEGICISENPKREIRSMNGDQQTEMLPPDLGVESENIGEKKEVV